MAVVYFDSSALVKLLVAEPGAALVDELWDRAEVVISSRLAGPEVSAALAAAHRADRFTTRQYRVAAAEWATLWPSVRPVELTRDVAAAAGDLAQTHALTGADAVHLASALATGLDPIFAVWDRRLHVAAHAAGLAVAPASIDRPAPSGE